jgi:hypothetical protein
MSKAKQFDQCLALAGRIVSAYRAEAPEGCDPQNTFGTIAAVVGAGVSVAGGIMSYNAQKQQGRTSNMIAQLNSRQAEMNAMMQLLALKAQAKLQKRVAEAQFRMRKSEADARFANARVIEQTAEGQSRVARESIRRKTTEHRRLQGTQRAAIGKSGLTESGTWLDLLAETAAFIQLAREDSLHEDALNRRSLFHEAEMERFGGKMALAGATMDRSFALAESGLRLAAGQADYRSALREAEILRLSGGAQQQMYRGQAMGSLFSGISGAVGTLGRGVV